MKIFINIAILHWLFFSVSNSFGQTPSKDLLPIEVDDKFGFIDKKGTLVIEPQYAWASDFSEGVAVVRMSESDEEYAGKYGYIDSIGKMVIPPMFDAASDFMQGWARVKQGEGNFIYIDKTGKMPVAATFFECYNVLCFPIPVRETPNSKAGYINRKGEYVIEAKFDMARPFVDGYAVVTVGEKRGYINLKGEFIIPPQFYRADYFQNGLAKVIVKDEQTGEKKEGYINKKGEFVVLPSFCVGCAKDFSDGLAAVSTADSGGKWGFIDTNGKMVIAPQFEKATIFSEGLAKVQLNGKYGFIDKSGNWVIKPKYDNVSDFNNGIASIYMKNERMGYIDKNENFVWRAEKIKKKEVEESPYDKY